MNYQETIIGGVLHWRSNKTDNWTEKTPQQLTQLLLEARRNMTRVSTPNPQAAAFADRNIRHI